mgnify:CR=1 FL=1
MNCCNDFGECTRGPTCPARREQVRPAVTYRTGWARLDNVLQAISYGTAVLAAMCVVALLITLIGMTGALR